jgi:hypothetical protein
LASELGERDGTPSVKHELAKKMNELVEVLNWQRATGTAATIAADAASLVGWPSAIQRPVHHHARGLRSTPWMDLESFPSVKVLSDLLSDRGNVVALRTEYDTLAATGAFQRQTECLHDPARGGWSYVAVVGDANPLACTTVTTPVACAWVGAARRNPAAASIVRVGYSAVEPGTWIRPHTGVDNRQLKLHLGLRVPKGDCASFTIGHLQPRGWREGGVIFFDDTYEHEVWNNCTTHRAVLQLVITHPDLR